MVLRVVIVAVRIIEMVVVDRAVPKVLFSSTPGRGLGEVTERFNTVVSFERVHGLHY
jgi:hypothetical protein